LIVGYCFILIFSIFC